MSTLHVANTFFEWELELPDCKQSLAEGFAQHLIYRQLQFLPALYATSQEGILLADTPDSEYWDRLRKLGIRPPRATFLSDPSFRSYRTVESWGASRLIAAFANKHGLNYSMPDWEVVKEVNSKRFSFLAGPKLPHACLLHHEEEAKEWLNNFKAKKVLKTCFGVSGKGHLILDESEHPWDKIYRFLNTEWKKGLPVIAEPWVDRALDFSTQWNIGQNKEVTYIGSTLCENDSRGRYRCNTVGEESALFGPHLQFLHTHSEKVKPILSNMAEKGYFGNVGIDAMLYRLPENGNELFLHPVVEINARKTMGWAALAFARRYFPSSRVEMRFATSAEGYLPQNITDKHGKEIRFQRNLTIAVYN